MGYRSRLTARGHKKAEAKRDKFESEMNSAFKGTRFGKNGYATRTTKQLQKSAKAYLKDQGYNHASDSNNGVHTMVPNVYSGRKKKRK